MKKLFFVLPILACMTVFNACNTKVDLYADYKDVPVIYGLIDVTQDTNYVKIVRAFSGSTDNPIDATQVALIADSSNYPGKLDARIIEFKKGFGNEYVPTGRVIVLDTTTIHDKNEGVFYAPNQKVYYTTERFNMNNSNTEYKYKLAVVRGNDTITSETGIVGGEDFKILTQSVTFSPTAIDKYGKVSFLPANNAAVYEVTMTFNYREQKPNEAMTNKQVSWSYGATSIDDLEIESNYFVVRYNQNMLFNELRSAIGADTLNVDRVIGPFEIRVSAGGRELYNYIQINSPSESLAQTIPDYTNVYGGFGVFSSRINLTSTAALSPKTQIDLIGMNWGFRQR